MVDLILKKRAGGAHTPEEIRFLVDGFVQGDVKDYQMSAWMMAVCFNGMTAAETGELTRAMWHSGEVVDLSDLPGVKLDKHSTGGVGDTTTLVIAPLVAACGGTVAKMSGRGLGHTGGTIDKLEAIPGVNIAQPIEDFKRIVRQTGLCVTGQTGDLVPADKLMYALRDVTGTVQSIPLIASSIMSKKLAAGTDAIVLDVKVGSGAFMQAVEEARELAQTMVQIGEHVGRKTVAILTDMNQPLGCAVGNALEVREAVQMLRGEIPEGDPLYKVCMLLATNMLLLGGVAHTQAVAEALLNRALYDGAGLKKLREMLVALGAQENCLENIDALCTVRRQVPVTLGRAGFVGGMQAEAIGQAAQMLGAGRAKKTDAIDPAVGLVMHKRQGDYVLKDEPVATLYVNDEARLEEAMQALKGAIRLESEQPAPAPLVYDVVRAAQER
jgi:pyrimidine-nucleoside phosphorylase